MTQQDLSKYAKSKATDKVFVRGEAIYSRHETELVMLNKGSHIVLYRVTSSEGNDRYTVNISNYDRSSIFMTCNCPYDGPGICKHLVASLLDLWDRLRGVSRTKKVAKSKKAREIEQEIYPQENKTIQFHSISMQVFLQFADYSDYSEIDKMCNKTSILFGKPENNRVEITVIDDGEEMQLSFHRINPYNLVTSCSCGRTDRILCLHKIAVFEYLRKKDDLYYFDQLRDVTEEKEELLARFGYSLEDDYNKLFDFKVRGGDLYIEPKDKSIVPLDELSSFFSKDLSSQIKASKALTYSNPIKEKDRATHKYGIGYVLQYAWDEYSEEEYGFPILTCVAGKLARKEDQFSSKIKPLLDVVHTYNLKTDEKDQALLTLQAELDEDMAEQYIESKTGEGLISSYTKLELLRYRYFFDRLTEGLKHLVEKRTFVNLGEYNYYDSKIPKKDLLPVKVYDGTISTGVSVKESKDSLTLAPFINVEGKSIPFTEMEEINPYFLIANNTLFGWPSPETYLSFYGVLTVTRSLRLPLSQAKQALTEIVPALSQRNDILFEMKNPPMVKEGKPSGKKVFLKEYDELLIVEPVVSYNNRDINILSDEIVVTENGKTLTYLERDKGYEEDFRNEVVASHPDFSEQVGKDSYFYVPFSELLKGHLFLDFFQGLDRSGAEVYGREQIKKLKYNTNKPVISLGLNSGIDWFDVSVEISFGEQQVTLKELQKAVQSGEEFVRLDDGSLGILPREWIKKYEKLFRTGKAGKDGVQVSKFNFDLIDELFEEEDDAEGALLEVREKIRKLEQFDKVHTKTTPKEIKAKLRDYQKDAFNWFHFLHDYQWGGCLADDMGLGKTLQVITFLRSLKGKVKKPHLIIMPTSLVFNWQNELKKFSPDLTFVVHTGINRKPPGDHFNKTDIVLTTYGIMTLDVGALKEVEFQYIVLDESHAIKNPTSKRYKAVKLLQAENRLALTGTPVENNTFDLYAQLNFLNPGMLGSMKGYKDNYVTPIDKHGDGDRAQELQKLVRPFVLRRTKEQVAKELPEKSENILFCEMAPDQRKVYEQYKDRYRQKIMNKIDEKGLKNAGMYVLEGLLKLRQICDDVSLLNDGEKVHASSVKIKELMRHLEEKTGDHKVLVFSQFTGMLKLVEEHLKKDGLAYSYLDGSSSNREKIVTEFVENDKIRIFLISLKAGGVGINLTAADYVFLVDPWWNPAVESQAIDRSHRIGQDKKVFAYKMICSDTIEEKVLELQKKKKKLAEDLISTEKGFIKNMSKEDISNLFG